MRILIAEDDPKLLKSLVHIFELNNYAVDGVIGIVFGGYPAAKASRLQPIDALHNL